MQIVPVTLADVQTLCEAHHAYGGVGASATYAFGVVENDRLVAAYSWQPPPVGAARGFTARARMASSPSRGWSPYRRASAPSSTCRSR